ncbi:MAG: hypothetical protein U9R79_10385 [Armatimonadota bacterium]|nr:hypothetical protein [Armatimonadota bacterium]
MIEAHRQPVSQQLWRVAAAVDAYARWTMDNIDAAALYGDPRFGDDET